MHWRVVLGFCLFFWMALPGTDAQPGFFNFNYPGPNTIPVIPGIPGNCVNKLAGNMGTPTVTSAVGATITNSAFDPVQSMFQLTDDWNIGEVAQVYWKVADDQGHTATFEFFVTFTDTTAPVVNTGGLLPSVQYFSIRQVPPPPILTASDSCFVTLNVLFEQSTPPALCQGGTFTRTWTAVDQSGNTGRFTQTILIHSDTLPPVVTGAPQNGSASCTQTAAAYPAWLAAQMAAFKATDPSGVASYSNNAPPSITGACPPPLTVTFLATDSCGFSATRTATFTVLDTHGPDVVVAPKDSIVACSPPAGNHLAALADWIHRRAGLVAQDSCTPAGQLTYFMQIGGQVRDSAQVVAAFQASTANGCITQMVGAQTVPKVRAVVRVDFYAADACGKSSLMGHADFAAIDTLPPVLSGNPLTEECGGGNDNTALVNWINNPGNISASDACSAFTWTDFSWVTATGQTGSGSFGSGPYPTIPANNCNWHVDVTFRATDDCGNIGSTTLRFRIADSTPPVFPALPAGMLYCPNVTPPKPLAQVSDNCDTSIVITSNFQIINQLCSDSYDMLVTWTATDDCGNTRTATQTFMVRDTTAPVFTLVPPNITVRCDTFALPPAPVLGQNIAASDVCGDILGVIYSDLSNQNPNPATCAHYTYTIVRKFTIADDCGNSATAQQIIEVTDNIPPVISGFLDTTLVCAVPEPLTPAPTATDVCTGFTSAPVLQSQDLTGGACPDSYTRTLTWASTDLCGNTGYFTQDIHIVDTVKPALSGVPGDIFVECNAVPPPPPLSTITGADNCDEDVDIQFSETEIRDPNPANCAHWTNYMVIRQWTASDNCGNSRTYTQTISVQDNTGPELVAVDTVGLPAAPGLCGANVVVPALVSVFDDCTASKTAVTLRDTVILTPSGTPVDQTPVDTVVFGWSSPNMPPGTPATGMATLAVALDSADSELLSETFEIYGEDGYHIGRTKLTNVPCGFSGDTTFSIPANLINSWLSDGQLNILLAPNGTGAFACNAYCSGGRARATLAYSVATQDIPVTVTCAIDNDPAMPYPPANSFFLDVGSHTVTYVATDCAGNASTATTIVRIEDLEPPVVTAAGAITTYVSVANCLSSIPLPFPTLSENCSFSGNLMQSSLLTPVQFELDGNAGWVPKNMTLSIPGVLPNAVTSGQLTIRHLGDNGDWGEFFKVLDEQNVFLSNTTNSTSGECTTAHESSFPVSAAQINSWATDGLVNVKLQANRDVVGFTEFIAPCGPLNAGNFDGISKVQAILTYNFAVVDYEVKKGAQTVQSGQLTGNQTVISLPPGDYTVFYRVSDNQGNLGSASFPLTVRDTIDPVAKCKPITIFTNPTGTANYTLQPQEINNGSVDNCSGTNLTFQVSQSVFTCNMATAPPGNVYPVTLTVTDTSGNSSSCNTTIQVRTANCSPTVTPGVCEGGTVQLMANPPAPATGYSAYLWNGPNMFVSMAPNPFIPGATAINEGTYSVTVTGQTGCTSVGNILLDLTTLPNQPQFTADVPSLICEGATLTLKCLPYGGNNVLYSWYSGTPDNATLLGTTTITTFQAPLPAVGMHQYFVKVAADGCTSVPSDVKTITVQQRPVALVNTPLISVCPCESIALGTPVQGPSITYLWNGPPGFPSSTLPNPLVTSCAQDVNKGKYTLTVFANGCASVPDTVTVDVRPKPAKPVVVGPTSVCQGDSIVLSCFNVPTAVEYRWTSPADTVTVTGINQLIIPNVSLSHAGSWRLQALQNNCLSDASDPKVIQVDSFPNVSATSNSPVCQGKPLTLTANSTTPNVTYKWSNTSSFFAIGSPVTDATPASGDYTVTVSTGFNCTNTAVVPVNVVTPPYLSAVTNTGPICTDCNTDALLQSTVFTENLPLTYAWSGGPGGDFMSTMPEAVIPDVCTDDNGTYNLIVMDAYGCASNQGSTVVNVQRQPERPFLSADTTYCAGSAFSISLANPNVYGSNISFEWHTPNGVLQQAQSKLTIPVSGIHHSGDYWLVAKAGDCASAPSDPVRITIHPIPPAPTPSSNSAVCEGSTLQLFADSIPAAHYAWTGPPGTGFTSSIKDPIIPAAAEVHEGCYSVVVTANGCVSAPGVTCVEVKKRPNVPDILKIDPICLSNPGAILTLKVNPNPVSATPMAQYTWFNAQTLDQLGPPTFALTYQLTDLSTLSAGTNSFFVQASLNGCITNSAVPASVTLDTIPPGSAFAGLNFYACDADSIQLNAQPPSGNIKGSWSQWGTPKLEIIDPSLPSTAVLNGVAGNEYYFIYALSNGACINYSSDTVKVTVNAYVPAKVAFEVVQTCNEDSIAIEAVPDANVAGFWTQPLGQTLQNPPVIIDDPNNPVTAVRNLPGPNSYFFLWNINVPGCSTSIDTVFVYTYGAKPNAGKDQDLCSNDYCTLLTASPALKPFESGKWTYLDSTATHTVTFNDPRNTSTTVCNLKTGENRFQWETNGGKCGDRSRDTVVVTFHLEPTAVADTLYVPFGEKRSINALLNDIVPPEHSVEVLEAPAPAEGQWEETADGTFSFLPNLTFSGTTALTYELCNIEPTCACKSAQVFFIVGKASDCKIPNIITPNGDGVNDIFVIPPQCLINSDGPPDNEVTIFNQWGDQVYNKKDYQNDWNGYYNNDRLPPGTYYYVVKLPGETKALTGFLLIQW